MCKKLPEFRGGEFPNCAVYTRYQAAMLAICVVYAIDQPLDDALYSRIANRRSRSQARGSKHCLCAVGRFVPSWRQDCLEDFPHLVLRAVRDTNPQCFSPAFGNRLAGFMQTVFGGSLAVNQFMHMLS